MIIVGIDIGKHRHEASIIDSDGKVLCHPFSFANSQAGLSKLMQAVRGLKQPVTFGLEATGHYWLALYTHLRQEGYPVCVINPIQSDALRELYIRKTKNDARDSFIIAEVIRFGRYTNTQIVSGDLLSLRELCRQRFYLVDQISSLKRKVIALMDQLFPEYEKLFSDLFGASSLELLSTYTTPEEIAAVDTDKLAELLSTASRGRLGRDKALEIQDAARNAFGILLGGDTLALIIRQQIQLIRVQEQAIAVLEGVIARMYDSFDTQLTTITGIGPTLAAVIFSEIGDIKRFDSPVKLAAFAGVDPTVKQSGDFSATHCKMSKRGSPYLRRAIWLAALNAAFKDPAIHAYYDKKRAEGKPHMTVMGHVCRKMVSIIFAVLRDNSPYVPVFPQSNA